MAKKILVQLVDDIDDTPIDSGGESISFSVNGVEYTIDLNDKNAIEFHRKLDYYIQFSTKVGGRKKRPLPAGSVAPPTKRDPEQTKAIREWANSNGYEVSARGRIPAEIEEAFDSAH
ncbi:MAG: histone-like nucleoid-structuring protein Lsr2 [Mycobacteriaceae bacterium]